MRPDTLIKSDVECELQWHPRINDRQISVRVIRGILTLAGRVDGLTCRLAAENVGCSIAGVRAIVSNIRIDGSSSASRLDEKLATAALHALCWNPSTHGQKILPIVCDGRLRLAGKVPWMFQKDAAARVVGRIPGILGVANEIQVPLFPSVGMFAKSTATARSTP